VERRRWAVIVSGGGELVGLVVEYGGRSIPTGLREVWRAAV
jgi:hypothetical protein